MQINTARGLVHESEATAQELREAMSVIRSLYAQSQGALIETSRKLFDAELEVIRMNEILNICEAAP